MRKHIPVVMTAILVLALATVAMAGDPRIGTYKLNLAKSKYTPGPPPKSGTLKIEAQDNGFKYVVDGVNAQGNATHSVATIKFDGKDYPIVGSTTGESVASTRIDANTSDQLIKRAGKEVGTGREVISPDGKTYTRTVKSKNAQGQDTSSIAVYDKQ